MRARPSAARSPPVQMARAAFALAACATSFLGVRFIDGEGRLLRVGGKVVKNAAGFDLPKFFVGSLGRFGILARSPSRCCPRPISTRTLRLHSKDLPGALRMVSGSELAAGNRMPWRFPVTRGTLHVAAGRTGSRRCPRFQARSSRAGPARSFADGEAAAFWTDLARVGWAHAEGVLVRSRHLQCRISSAFVESMGRLPETRVHMSRGRKHSFWCHLPAIEPASEVTTILARSCPCRRRLARARSALAGQRPSTASPSRSKQPSTGRTISRARRLNAPLDSSR